jgi:hypothetical protein
MMAETEEMLDRELAHFGKIKEELLKNHPNKFALIKDEDFIGAFDSATNAYEAGVQRVGNVVFLVKKITAEEEVYRNQALDLGLLNARL